MKPNFSCFGAECGDFARIHLAGNKVWHPDDPSQSASLCVTNLVNVLT